MKLGIDFGTTHTVVTAMDRGNYPVVSFSTPEGDWMDYFPSLIAVREGEHLFGFEAQSVLDDPNWTIIRSFKSLLRNVNQNKFLTIQGKEYDIINLTINFLKKFKHCLFHESNISLEEDKLAISIAVPAHTTNTQRFMTAECFTRAGFDVVNMINEPSAITMEYTSSFFKQVERSTKKYLLVYDMGGGTFDASIAEIHDKYHKIIATEGIDTLGGNQFDEILAEMVKEQLPPDMTLNMADEVRLLELCKVKKESLTPHTRNILLEWGPDNGPDSKEPQLFRLPVKEYYARCEPLINRTIKILDHFVSRISIEESFAKFSAVYLVGGMSNFPYMARMLRQTYGNHRIRKSQHCASSVAIGLAILMDKEQDFVLKESLTRYFGLWREGEQGTSLVFDPIFKKNQLLPAKNEPPIVFKSKYHPSHNIGNFRFQECTILENNKPSGLITVWSQISFPFDPNLQDKQLEDIEVTRYPTPLDFEIEEIYSLNFKGEITAQLINHQTGYSKKFQLYRM